MVDFAAARLNMVESQLRTNKVTNGAVLDAFERTPRELFVPESRQGIAYVDEDIEIGSGRHLMEPMVLARLLQAAQPGPSDVVLDIACGTGYATALLAGMAATVVALESDEDLAASATDTLAVLEADNAVVVKGRLNEGYPAQAPYNVILIGGGVAEVPEVISRQLAEGGRLVAVIKDSGSIGRATLLECHGDVVSGRVLFDAAVPSLPEFEPAPRFVF